MKVGLEKEGSVGFGFHQNEPGGKPAIELLGPGAESDAALRRQMLLRPAVTSNVSVTVGFESDDCDRDFRAVIERGGIALEPPTNKDWGVRTAYFKGPGELKFEIEDPITNR